MAPAKKDGGSKKGPRLNVTRSLRDVIEEVERLWKNQRRDHARTEKVLWELYTIERASAEKDGPVPPRRPLRRAAVLAGPAPVAQVCEPHGVKGGGVVVTFDSGKQVALPRALAELFRVLVSGEGPSPDELVAWNSFDRMGKLLEQRLGRPFNHHTVSQLLTRLRGKLEEADLDPRLVESSAALGARLRLKRRPPVSALSAG